MERLYAAVVIISIVIIGFLKLRSEAHTISKKHAFANEFFSKLKDYIDSDGKNLVAYTWLTSHSNQMQIQMGSDGIYAAYKPPGAHYQIPNYPIILNMLPELRRSLDTQRLSNMLASEYSSLLQEALIRHIGTIEDIIKDHASELRNPIIWFREGMRVITASPITLLSWLGLIGASTLRKITKNSIFKIIAAIFAIVGFLSAVVSLVIGWDQFVTILKRLFS